MPRVDVNEYGKIGIQMRMPDKIFDIEEVRYSLLGAIPRGWQLGTAQLSAPPGDVCARLHHLPALRSVHGIERAPVERQQTVAVAESRIVHLRREVEPLCHGLIRHYAVAPMKCDACVYYDCEDKVQQNACHHHEQTLPRRLAAELPWLGLGCEVFAALGFVHHAGDVAVAAEGQPSEAVYGVAPCGLRSGCGRVRPSYL